MAFSEYIALGDSMSIDLYPALDAGDTDVAVALEWNARAGAVARLGAASLLFQNVDERYPEFTGRDLTSTYPGIGHVNVAEDGATIGDVFGSQLSQITPSEDPVLFTLSIGGNDLLSAFSNRPKQELLHRIVQDIAEAYEFLVESLFRSWPAATLVLTTIYDPSDDTRSIPGIFEAAGSLPLEPLYEMNEEIRRIARTTPRTVVADVYRHFMGHGVTAEEAERWYWKRSWIEPNALGASEIRRLWLDAVEATAEN